MQIKIISSRLFQGQQLQYNGLAASSRATRVTVAKLWHDIILVCLI